MKDLDTESFVQTGRPSRYLFYCRLAEADLRGTAALRYIRAMAKRAAAMKKQGRRAQTIEDALEAQSGVLWYAPKARPHKAHIWLRKAFDSVYAPYIFGKPAVVDQRCNFIEPQDTSDWQFLAAIVSSSLFALALESTGAAAMGAGALEVPTKRLREMPVIDYRKFTPADCQELIELARRVWKEDRPVDWRQQDRPGEAVVALDQFLLRKADTAVTLQAVYKDIAEVCRARLRVAADKEVKLKKVVKQDIEAVAKAISESVRLLLEGKQFPEAFCPPGVVLVRYDFSGRTTLEIECQPLMSHSHLTIRDGSSQQVLVDKLLPREVAEVIVRALLIRRRVFDAPMEAEAATQTLNAFVPWLGTVLERIEEGCRSSALGTRYEQEVREAAMRQLGLHPETKRKELFGFYECAG